MNYLVGVGAILGRDHHLVRPLHRLDASHGIAEQSEIVSVAACKHMSWRELPGLSCRGMFVIMVLARRS